MNLWTIDDGKARLSFHQGQARAWRSERRFVFVIAGSQGGKTSFGPWWLYREVQEHGPGDYLAVTASYDLFKLKMLPEMRTVFETLLGVGRWWAGDKVLELREPGGDFWAKRSDDPMWGRIILRSASAGGGLESATAKAAWLDECGQDDFTLDDWDAVQARLSLYEGRALGTTTPYNLGWLKTEVYDAWEAGSADVDVINFASVVNPAFPRREFERRQKQMQDWRFEMRYRGQFTRPAGLIYTAFTGDMLIDAFPIPDTWERVIGVDFGGANTAIVYLAQDPESAVWYCYQEQMTGGKTSAGYAQEVLEALPQGVRYQVYGGAKSEGQHRLDWLAGGLMVQEPPVDDVESGIDRVTQLMKSGRFRLFRTLRGLRDELGSYRRKLDAMGNPTDDIDNKRHFHRLDALRYASTGISYHGGWVLA